MTTKQLDTYFRSFLDIEGFLQMDDSVNGLQVDNDGRDIRKVAFAVDACLESFSLAAQRGAGMLFVHHGLLWGKPAPITGIMRQRLQVLMANNIALYGVHLPLDQHPEVYKKLLPFCRLKRGEIWRDPLGRHRVGCLDAADPDAVRELMKGRKAALAVHDPPYNLAAFEERSVGEYIRWSRKWISNTIEHLAPDASLYIWLGADQKNHFQPLPEFMLLMREFPSLRAASFITMRNQRG